eukprot:2980797-Lingulodinium_polyedra.AAC.1
MCIRDSTCALHARARKLARAWSAQVCGSRAAAAAGGRFDRIVAQNFQNVAQRCGRIVCALSQRLA